MRSSAWTVDDQLGLDATFELLPVGFRDIRVGPDDAQRDAEDIQGRLGLAGIIQFASRLQSLLDVIGQLLAGEVLGRLGLLQGGLGIGRGIRGRCGRRRAGLRRRRCGSGILHRDADDRVAGLLGLLEPSRRGLVGRVEQEGFLEERPGGRLRALRESLPAQIGQLLREGRILGTEG